MRIVWIVTHFLNFVFFIILKFLKKFSNNETIKYYLYSILYNIPNLLMHLEIIFHYKFILVYYKLQILCVKYKFI